MADRLGRSGRVQRHGLAHEGAPHDSAGNRIALWMSAGVGGAGRAKCSCGELSDVLASAIKRKAWHRAHKAEAARGTGAPE